MTFSTSQGASYLLRKNIKIKRTSLSWSFPTRQGSKIKTNPAAKMASGFVLDSINTITPINIQGYFKC
jgi:hypothetical protein